MYIHVCDIRITPGDALHVTEQTPVRGRVLPKIDNTHLSKSFKRYLII